MKRDENNGSTGRICTRSLASALTEQETPALRRSSRGSPSTKLIAPTSTTRKSERLASSPASATGKSGRMEMQKSDKGKNVSLEDSKRSNKYGRNAYTSSDMEESRDKTINNIEELINKIKKSEPQMRGQSYRALTRGFLKVKVNASSNDEELVVVGCSRRMPAGNDDARDDNSSLLANLE